jgi:hypothetical protein
MNILNFFRKKKIDGTAATAYATSNYQYADLFLEQLKRSCRTEKDIKEIIYTMARKTGHYISKMPKRDTRKSMGCIEQ